MNIVLLGFMGTGKSSVGKKLAQKLEMHFVETDDMIEKECGLPIWRIFSDFGEKYFRTIEKKIISRVSKLDNSVISTGGGAVLFSVNIKNLKKNGKLFCLIASPQEISRRLMRESNRPLLKVKNPQAKIMELLKQRAPLYSKIDNTIDTSNLTADEVVEKIVKILSGD